MNFFRTRELTEIKGAGFFATMDVNQCEVLFDDCSGDYHVLDDRYAVARSRYRACKSIVVLNLGNQIVLIA
jgi:hypothetical protein